MDVAQSIAYGEMNEDAADVLSSLAPVMTHLPIIDETRTFIREHSPTGDRGGYTKVRVEEGRRTSRERSRERFQFVSPRRLRGKRWMDGVMSGRRGRIGGTERGQEGAIEGMPAAKSYGIMIMILQIL